jgi:CubicO group peptidase (beta-lactamase class C family)
LKSNWYKTKAMNRLILMSIMLLFVGMTCGFSQSKNKVSNKEMSEKMNELLSDYESADSPGLGVSVVNKGKVVYQKSIGLANLEYAVPISEQSIFHVASVSKQFTAFAILLLEEEGTLSINDSIAKYLPELSEVGKSITIKHFMNHTSGFRDIDDLKQMQGIAMEDLMGNNRAVQILLNQTALNFVPGSQFEYSNSGFILLAEIVKRVSGMPFSEFMSKRVFKPLEMKHSFVLDDSRKIIKNAALSYEKYNKDYIKCLLNSTQVGSTGLNTTVGDLNRWCMNFENPVIGNVSLFEKMRQKSVLNNGDTISYALGQEVKKYKGLDVIFHGGGDAGYRSYIIRIPKYKFSLAVVGNFKSFNPLDIAYKMVDIYLAEFQTKQEEIIVPNYTNTELKQFEGFYKVFPGLYISTISRNDSLFFQPYNTTDMLHLPTIAASTFSFPYIPHSRMHFVSEGKFFWHLSDFKYRGLKMPLPTIDVESIDYEELEGTYYNSELNTSYRFVMENGKLFAKHTLNYPVEFTPFQTDVFISNTSFLGEVKFVRNSEGKIKGCKIYSQKVKGIEFKKTEL